MGVAIVVPAKQILEVLNHPSLVAAANALADEDDYTNSATPDVAD
jgi:hypothetical protein